MFGEVEISQGVRSGVLGAGGWQWRDASLE